MPNPAFAPFENDFWHLYRTCRYHELICRERVARAVRIDTRANWWLVASTVGAASVGAIRLATGISTEVVWEVASVVSLWFAFTPLMSRSSDIRYSVFASSAVFDSLASEVAATVIRSRHGGTAQEISEAFDDLRNKYIMEYQSLGAEHTKYEADNRKRLESHLDDVLRKEGRSRP